jgi:phosphatidylserine decarboxylase
VTVKPYVFSTINILERNRRAVLVIENPVDGMKVAMVIIGGITVDSIRMDPLMKEGEMVSRGQRVGSFARVCMQQCILLCLSELNHGSDIG